MSKQIDVFTGRHIRTNQALGSTRLSASINILSFYHSLDYSQCASIHWALELLTSRPRTNSCQSSWLRLIIMHLQKPPPSGPNAPRPNREASTPAHPAASRPTINNPLPHQSQS